MENFKPEKEEYLSPEDKWAYEINAREKLWKDTICAADVPPEIKIKLIKTIDNMSMPSAHEGSIDSWARDFVDYLLMAVGNMKGLEFAKNDTRALFEGLRDDIYSFVADLKK